MANGHFGLGLIIFVAGACVGGLGVRGYDWYNESAAKDKQTKDLLGNTTKIANIVTADERAAASAQRAADRRKEVYDADKDAQAWAAQRIPEPIADELRNSALAAERASARAGKDVPSSPK